MRRLKIRSLDSQPKNVACPLKALRLCVESPMYGFGELELDAVSPKIRA
jgi:hypothetical protein